MKIKSLFLLVFSIASIKAEYSVKKLTLDDKIEIMQVAKITAQCDKQIFSHVAYDNVWCPQKGNYQLISRNVYRPMNQQETEQEIDRSKMLILQILTSGNIDIFVCHSNNQEFFHGCIFAQAGKRSFDLVEYQKIYISSVGNMNFYHVMNKMSEFIEKFYKDQSFKYIALESKVSYSHFFKNNGYSEFSNAEASLKGFQDRNSIKTSALIAASIAALTGFGFHDQKQRGNRIISICLLVCSVISTMSTLDSLITSANSIVYYKKLN